MANATSQPRPRWEKRRLAEAYLDAREVVVLAGFGSELDWQDSRRFDSLNESTFLQEAAWVVLSAGLSELVVRRVFAPISEAFLWWTSAAAIAANPSDCIRRASPTFRHFGKLRAITSIAEEVHSIGFDRFSSEIARDGVDRLQQLDFVGPVTAFHLAKNLGMDVVKPDRHLVRLAEAAGATGPHELCADIAEYTGDRLSTIDIVLWRYATLVRDYLKRFCL